jgi:general secretion pathway protein J
MKRDQRGFTLVELVVAMVLLATMLLLLYSGLNFAARSWDSGDVAGRRVADRRIGENFLRREISELFPMRFRDVTLKFAFEGQKNHLAFVSSRPAGLAQGGLSAGGARRSRRGRGSRARNLVMRRAMPDDEQKSFAPLDQAEPTVILAGVTEVSFDYFGAENDFTQPAWNDVWAWPCAHAGMIRMRMRTRTARSPS